MAVLVTYVTHGLIDYPAPGRGTGVLFSLDFFLSFFLCLFVSLSARVRENGWTDCMKFSGKVRSDHGTT